jgi:hypothetical protein
MGTHFWSGTPCEGQKRRLWRTFRVVSVTELLEPITVQENKLSFRKSESQDAVSSTVARETTPVMLSSENKIRDHPR